MDDNTNLILLLWGGIIIIGIVLMASYVTEHKTFLQDKVIGKQINLTNGHNEIITNHGTIQVFPDVYDKLNTGDTVVLSEEWDFGKDFGLSYYAKV